MILFLNLCCPPPLQFVVNGVHAYAPNGPFTPSVDIYYKDTPNKVEIKCEEDPVNNQIVFDVSAHLHKIFRLVSIQITIC